MGRGRTAIGVQYRVVYIQSTEASTAVGGEVQGAVARSVREEFVGITIDLYGEKDGRAERIAVEVYGIELLVTA